jgi:hypothetical protein
MYPKKMLGALLVSAALPMALLAIGSPAANAVSVSSEITTYDDCVWALNDVPSTINLNTDEVYKGDAMMVATQISPKLGFAGDTASATAGDSKACSFYNSVATKKLTIALAGANNFVASFGGLNAALDPDSDFGLSESRTLNMTVDLTNCTVPVSGVWASVGKNFTDLGSHDTVLFGWGGVQNPADTYETGDASRCAPAIILTLEIPGTVGAPEGAGEQYSFAGPNMTFNLASND